MIYCYFICVICCMSVLLKAVAETLWILFSRQHIDIIVLILSLCHVTQRCVTLTSALSFDLRISTFLSVRLIQP